MSITSLPSGDFSRCWRSERASSARAIAGILIRSDTQMLARAELARSLRQHRLKSPDGNDVIDMLIRMLQST